MTSNSDEKIKEFRELLGKLQISGSYESARLSVKIARIAEELREDRQMADALLKEPLAEQTQIPSNPDN